MAKKEGVTVMRNKVYSFQPKGKGYNVYATKTYHGKSSRSSSSRRSGGVVDALIGLAAKGIVRGIIGMKKK